MRCVPARAGRWVLVVLLAAVVVGFGLTFDAVGQNPGQPTRSDFMRKKLDYAQGLIEGLTLEDHRLITENARALKVLSQQAEWEVPMIPNVEQYLPYTTEFQRLCDELMKNGREANTDGATLTYVRLTLNCVNCHKYVRAMAE